MSFIGNIRAYAPRITRFVGSVAAGNDKDRRGLRISITVMIVLIVVTVTALSANGSLFATGFNDSSSVGLSDSLSISASPSTLNSGASTTLIAKIVHSFPNTKITVTITVNGPARSGAHGSKTITITTNSAGNGLGSVIYPFTQPFVGTASTSASGTYQLTATFVLVYPIGTATTTFTVR